MVKVNNVLDVLPTSTDGSSYSDVDVSDSGTIPYMESDENNAEGDLFADSGDDMLIEQTDDDVGSIEIDEENESIETDKNRRSNEKKTNDEALDN